MNCKSWLHRLLYLKFCFCLESQVDILNCTQVDYPTGFIGYFVFSVVGCGFSSFLSSSFSVLIIQCFRACEPEDTENPHASC